MPSNILKFSDFERIFEGGAAIKSSRRIREDEFKKTLESIQNLLFPIIGLDSDRIGDDYIVIGSIGKKKEPSDTSGDLDIGYNGLNFARAHGVTYKECSRKM